MDETLKSKGLLKRYNVTKADGTPTDPRAEYFILRLDDHGSDYRHIAACRASIMTYARIMTDHLPLLSQDLIQKYEAFEMDGNKRDADSRKKKLDKLKEFVRQKTSPSRIDLLNDDNVVDESIRLIESLMETIKSLQDDENP